MNNTIKFDKVTKLHLVNISAYLKRWIVCPNTGIIIEQTKARILPITQSYGLLTVTV